MRQREAKISDAIREAVAAMPGVILWRNSPTLAKVRGGRAWCGLPRGSADLVGLVEVKIHPDSDITIGRFLALEVKAPGEIPMPEDIERALAKLGPAAVAMFNARSFGPAWEKMIGKLEEDARHMLQQEAWLAGVRAKGGFAVYVDSVDSARSAVDLARVLDVAAARWRVVMPPAKDCQYCR